MTFAGDDIPPILLDLPARPGDRPQTGPAMPHYQLTDPGDLRQAQLLLDEIGALPGVHLGRSQVSDPRSVAFHLEPDLVRASRDEAPLGGEFAHVHPYDGGSQHLVLPTAWGEHLIARGWAEYHPLVQHGGMPPVFFLVYGARDDADRASIATITRAAYAHVRGLDPGEVGPTGPGPGGAPPAEG